jgi:hypothetical protein
MAKFKSLIVGSKVVPAGRARKCYHSNKHGVRKGDLVLEVKVGMGWHGYCTQCALEMIEESVARLSEVRQELNS